MTRHNRRHHLLCLDGLPFSNHSNFFINIKAHDDGSAKRNFFWGVATNHWVPHVEELVANVGLNTSVHVHTLRHPRLKQIIFGGERLFNERRRYRYRINFLAAESQPHRLRLFNDAHLNTPNLRHFSALHLIGDANFDGVVGGGLKVPNKTWKFRVGFENNFGTSNPLLQDVRPCSHGIGHDALKAILLYDLAGHSARKWVCQQG